MDIMNRVLRETDKQTMKKMVEENGYGYFIICNDEVSKETMYQADIVARLAQIDLDLKETPSLYFYRDESFQESFRRLWKDELDNRIIAPKSAVAFMAAQGNDIYLRFDGYNQNFKEMANSILHESLHVFQHENFSERQKNESIRAAFEAAARMYGDTKTSVI